MGLLDLIVPGGSAMFDAVRGTTTGMFSGMAGAGSDPRAAITGATQGMQQGRQRDDAMGLIQKQEQEKKRVQEQEAARQNATLKWLQENAPEYAGLAEAGGISPGDVFKMALDQKGPNAETWGLTPQPYQIGDEVKIGVMSNRGNFKEVGLPQGAQPVFPVQQLNTGTEFIPRDKFGNPVGPATPINNTQAEFDKGIGGELAKDTVESRNAALEAEQSLRSTQEARKLLDSGVITGFGANWIVGFGKALQQIGVNYAQDEIANTEAFVATRAQEVGRLIQLFGAGTGLSDADREFATKAAAGSIEMTEASIRRILEINERAAMNVISQHNARVPAAGEVPSLAVGGASLPPTAGGGTLSNGLTWSVEQ